MQNNGIDYLWQFGNYDLFAFKIHVGMIFATWTEVFAITQVSAVKNNIAVILYLEDGRKGFSIHTYYEQ